MFAMSDTRLFLQQFLRAPTAVGAIAPSSVALARQITAGVPVAGEPVILELGPGTGVFTAQIQRRLGGRGRHVAVEVNPALAGLLRERYPAAEVVEADAGDAASILAERGIDGVDVVVSGLPWSVFPAELQERILDAVGTVLRPTGHFVTFNYLQASVLPPALAFRRRLAERFAEVSTSATVWRNLPPARILTGRQPRTRS